MHPPSELWKAVFDGYRMISCYPGRKGNGRLSYGAWMELVSDSNLLGGDFPRRNIGLAFALAQELKADVCSDWRGMEVSWSEFLVAIAALVVLKPGHAFAQYFFVKIWVGIPRDPREIPGPPQETRGMPRTAQSRRE